MGEALGKAFVEKTFSAKAKERALEMIANIRKALKADLTHLDWLDDATRAKALEKLEKISQKIGYPEKWKDYSTLEISRKSFLTNVIHSFEFAHHDRVNKIGGPVDPTLWGMTPQTVNAYYAPDLNQINFPAGILQAPFFNEKFSDAANYGGIGLVIGHEITHGFDTVGSKFDGRGMMTDWWTAKVKTQFNEKTSCMKKQYSAYHPLPDLAINGELTITENIADNGGLKISYAAFHMAHAGDVSTKEDQQFFLSAAQSWCRKASEEAIRRQISGDPHSPAQFRIDGAFQNNLEFAKAYSCAAGKPMAPANRCFIW
jgi:putative endopeptidase